MAHLCLNFLKICVNVYVHVWISYFHILAQLKVDFLFETCSNCETECESSKDPEVAVARSHFNGKRRKNIHQFHWNMATGQAVRNFYSKIHISPSGNKSTDWSLVQLDLVTIIKRIHGRDDLSGLVNLWNRPNPMDAKTSTTVDLRIKNKQLYSTELKLPSPLKAKLLKQRCNWEKNWKILNKTSKTCQIHFLPFKAVTRTINFFKYIQKRLYVQKYSVWKYTPIHPYIIPLFVFTHHTLATQYVQ